VPNDVIKNAGLSNVVKSSNGNLTVQNTYDFGNYASVKGNVDAIDAVAKVFIYVLNQSEAQLQQNYERAVSEGVNGFNTKLPS